jgi:3-methyladenine DNA glycosylase Mpg
MPPRKRTTPAVPAQRLPSHATVSGRKVTRTLTVDATFAAMEALANRADPPLALDQVGYTFEAERIAGPNGTNARWRFSIPGQMLVVAENDLPIIGALIKALKDEWLAEQDGGKAQ